jgi:hypothetical protein
MYRFKGDLAIQRANTVSSTVALVFVYFFGRYMLTDVTIHSFWDWFNVSFVLALLMVGALVWALTLHIITHTFAWVMMNNMEYHRFSEWYFKGYYRKK